MTARGGGSRLAWLSARISLEDVAMPMDVGDLEAQLFKDASSDEDKEEREWKLPTI